MRIGDFYVFSPIFAMAFIPDPHNRLIIFKLRFQLIISLAF